MISIKSLRAVINGTLAAGWESSRIWNILDEMEQRAILNEFCKEPPKPVVPNSPLDLPKAPSNWGYRRMYKVRLINTVRYFTNPIVEDRDSETYDILGNKITAIKIVKNISGCYLKEAKEFVEHNHTLEVTKGEYNLLCHAFGKINLISEYGG